MNTQLCTNHLHGDVCVWIQAVKASLLLHKCALIDCMDICSFQYRQIMHTYWCTAVHQWVVWKDVAFNTKNAWMLIHAELCSNYLYGNMCLSIPIIHAHSMMHSCALNTCKEISCFQHTLNHEQLCNNAFPWAIWLWYTQIVHAYSCTVLQ